MGLYKTTFTVGNKTFEGLVNIRKSSNKKTLYDITNLKEVPYNGTSDESFSASVRTPLRTDNISQSNKDVKSNTLPTKYSMQENTNDTWQDTLKAVLPRKGKCTFSEDIRLPKLQEDNPILPKCSTKASSYEISQSKFPKNNGKVNINDLNNIINDLNPPMSEL